MIKDRNYLKQKEILKNVGKLLKKEDYLGNINYDRTIHYNIYLWLDRNYLKQKEMIKKVKKLLKIRVYVGKVNYDKRI